MNLILFTGRQYIAPAVVVVEVFSSIKLLNVSGAGLDPYNGENIDD